jgi:hypothetical protein
MEAFASRRRKENADVREQVEQDPSILDKINNEADKLSEEEFKTLATIKAGNLLPESIGAPQMKAIDGLQPILEKGNLGFVCVAA